jgi:hypothetical protein
MVAQTDDELKRELAELHRLEPHPGLEGDKLRVHLAIHVVVETQIRDGRPPETGETLRRLEAEGMSHHQALHAIGRCVSDELYGVMTEGTQYDEARYLGRLRALGRSGAG